MEEMEEMEDPTKRYGFDVIGGFSVRNELEPDYTYYGNINGFKLPDGRIIRLVAALEIESVDGASYEYVTSEKEMAELGMEGLDYAKLEFDLLDEQ